MIEVISAFPDLCALAPEWSQLWHRCPGATPFQSPEWLLPWWTHLFQGGEMWTLVVRDAGRLTGIAPMFLHGCAGQPRTLSFIGTGISDYLGFLAENARVVGEIWSGISAGRAYWDICDFQEIRADSPMLSGPGMPSGVQRVVSGVCPLVRLPATIGEFESRLAVKFRHNLRNARNRLARAGSTLETATPAQDDEFLGALFRLHAARWNSKGEPGMLSSVCSREFFTAACAGFRRRGWLRLHGLRLGGDLQAVVCTFCALRRSAYYIGGFDPSLAKLSPGNVLNGFAIEQAIAERCLEFDFLRNREAYKYDWGAEDRINTRLLVRNAEPERSAVNR